jgi:hypothetical protein
MMLRNVVVMAPEEVPATGAPPPAKPTEAPPAKGQETLLSAPKEGEEKPVEGKPVETAPTEFKITVPEGFDIDQKRFDGFVAFAKENKISQESAQKFFDQYVEQQRADTQGAQQRESEQITQWAEESKKTFGKDLDSTLSSAKKALTRFGDPELSEMLTKTGLGNHKAVIKLLAQVGSKIAEDKPVQGGAPGEGKQTQDDRLRAMYPNSPQMFDQK